MRKIEANIKCPFTTTDIDKLEKDITGLDVYIFLGSESYQITHCGIRTYKYGSRPNVAAVAKKAAYMVKNFI